MEVAWNWVVAGRILRHLIEKVVCLKDTVGRNKDFRGSSGKDWKTAKKSNRERNYCLREFIYYHEQGIATNVNIKDASGEVSRHWGIC